MPRGRALVSTGLRVAVPPGHVGLIAPRSGSALRHGIGMVNAPGVIDPPYTGVVSVLLHNTADEPFPVAVGDRIAQLVIVPVPDVRLVLAERLDEMHRGDGGFGSSGRR